jgi:fumarate reductase subunit C
VEVGVSANYTEFHPRWYRPRTSVFWWVGRRSYLVFVLRELSSVFVAWSVVFLLLLIHAVSQGGKQYQQFLNLSSNPWMLSLNVIALAFLVFHVFTWFNLAPQAMVIRQRGKRVPRSRIISAHYAGWALLSALAAWLILR